jgi:hypothetical protein
VKRCEFSYLQRELDLKRKMRGVDNRSEYEIARDRAEAGEDDDDDGIYLTLTTF